MIFRDVPHAHIRIGTDHATEAVKRKLNGAIFPDGHVLRSDFANEIPVFRHQPRVHSVNTNSAPVVDKMCGLISLQQRNELDVITPVVLKLLAYPLLRRKMIFVLEP